MDARYDNPQVRRGDLEQLERISASLWQPHPLLTEVALDPPETTGDEAGAPLLDEDWLTLSTIHSAKGQEWKAVFVLNCVDGCIPSDLSTGRPEDVEEERRLLYVAMTRARDDLHLLHPLRFFVRSQHRHGDAHVMAPPQPLPAGTGAGAVPAGGRGPAPRRRRPGRRPRQCGDGRPQAGDARPVRLSKGRRRGPVTRRGSGNMTVASPSIHHRLADADPGGQDGAALLPRTFATVTRAVTVSPARIGALNFRSGRYRPRPARATGCPARWRCRRRPAAVGDAPLEEGALGISSLMCTGLVSPRRPRT